VGLTLSTVARALVRRRSGGKAWVMVQKGNGNSSPHLKNEIELATPKSERRELREAELLDVGRQESEMNLEHDPLRLLRETTTTRARRRNMRDFNTKREESKCKTESRCRNRAVENRRTLQTISARVGRQDGFETGDIGPSRSRRTVYRIAHQTRWGS
jgi:hypothetical protein